MLCPESLLGRRQATRRRYDSNDSMNVIRHDHVWTQFDPSKMRGDFAPARVDDLSSFIQLDGDADNLAEDPFAAVGANRQEVRFRRRIIEKRQAN